MAKKIGQGGDPAGEIYLHWCPTSGKGYVGQTTQGVAGRWKTHIKCAHSPRTPNYNGLFAKAIRKYGPDAFEHSVLSVTRSQEQLDNLEKVWIILLQTKAPNGYNLTDGGDSGTAGHVVSFEVRARLSAATREQWQSPDFRARYHALRAGKKQPGIAAAKTGLKQSAETIAKRVAKTTGKKRTPEQLARMRAGMQGSHLGKPWTATQRAARERGRTNG